MTVEVFVTIHSQDLLIEREAEARFARVPHRYVFVGPRPVDRLSGLNAIVAREWAGNREHLPAFYDFTGWFILAKYVLTAADNVILLQDDMTILDDGLVDRCDRLLAEAPGPVAFNAGYASAGNWMLAIAGFAEAYNAGMATVGVDPSFPPFDAWPSTQGMAWRMEDLELFMDWFEPLFDVWADNIWAGHLAERSVKAWCVVSGKPERLLPGVISHESRDLHGTGALMRGDRHTYERRAATFGK